MKHAEQRPSSVVTSNEPDLENMALVLFELFVEHGIAS
ncbi:hypothetical protein SAMN06296056_103392 [Priestia filamentosa]|nr:hypothetical protein SAMN06296056_103392 [Priestia filamentosa]